MLLFILAWTRFNTKILSEGSDMRFTLYLFQLTELKWSLYHLFAYFTWLRKKFWQWKALNNCKYFVSDLMAKFFYIHEVVNALHLKFLNRVVFKRVGTRSASFVSAMLVMFSYLGTDWSQLQAKFSHVVGMDHWRTLSWKFSFLFSCDLTLKTLRNPALKYVIMLVFYLNYRLCFCTFFKSDPSYRPSSAKKKSWQWNSHVVGMHHWRILSCKFSLFSFWR